MFDGPLTSQVNWTTVDIIQGNKFVLGVKIKALADFKNLEKKAMLGCNTSSLFSNEWLMNR